MAEKYTEVKNENIIIDICKHQDRPRPLSPIHMACSKPLVVAAIDFGTTHSAWAFSPRHQFKSDPLKVFVRHWSGNQLLSEKAPSCVLIENDGETVHSFGFDAETKYDEITADGDQQQWYYFRRFKMMPFGQIGFKKNIPLEDVYGRKLPALKVFSLMIGYITKDIYKLISMGMDRIKEEDVHWVLTVPAIWNNAAKQFMREAAENAGIQGDQLTLALEPEAAFLYCRHLPVKRFKGDSRFSLANCNAGSKFLLLDLRGGEVDITAHEISDSGNLRELHQPSGGPWGGEKVDKAFEEFIEHLVGPEVMFALKHLYVDAYIDLLRDFEIKKRSITPEEKGAIAFRIPIALVELYKEVTGNTLKETIGSTQYADQIRFTRNKLWINVEVIKGLFSGPVQSIVNHVRDLLRVESVKGCSAIVLVGGFSESPILQGAIHGSFPQQKVIVPEDAGLAVLKGAVIFGHSPRAIAERVCKDTCGTDTIYLSSDSCDHPSTRRDYDEDGALRKYDTFDIHVTVGQTVKLGQEQGEQISTPVGADQTGLLKKISPMKKTSASATLSTPETSNSESDSDFTATSVCDSAKLPPLPNLSSSTLTNQVPPSQEVTSPRSIWDRARMGKLDIAKQQRITRTMAAFLVKDMRPFSTVASENFRSMIHAIDERVVIPNSNTFSHRIIPSWYNLEASKLIEELQSSKYVALTSDCWTSRTTIPYMTVTAHFLDDRYDLKSKVLQTRILEERHTGENISVALNSVLQSWKIEDKVRVITTDNVSNMGRTVDISDISLKIGCFAHTLDLAAKKAVAVAKPLSKKIKPVITFLHRSHIGAKVLVEKQEALNVPKHKLITDVETRWNSTYLMFERFFEQRVAVHATFMDKRLEEHKSIYRDFKDSEVVKAEEFLATMKPIYEMTLAISSETNPTASLILPLCDRILKRCEPKEGDSDFSKQLNRAIADHLSQPYGDKVVRDYLLKCTAIDPRMKLKSVVEESTWKMLSKEIVELLEREELERMATVIVKKEEVETDEPTETYPKKSKTLIETFLNDDDDDDNDDDEITVVSAYKRSHQEMADDELKSYRDMPKHTSPLQFYQNNRYRLPHLYMLAAKYLVAQATSVASERVFSTSGDILSSERSCLDPNSLDAMIFLKTNAKTADFLA